MSFLKGKRRVLIISLSVFLALAIITAACVIYLESYYRADNEAIATFMPDGCEWRVEENGNIVFEPSSATRGFIFYPGGKVDHNAYIPLMQACAERGIMCGLVEMPFNLAVLDMHAADGIIDDYPEIESWYIGGHSLGGAMAAAYLEKNHED